MSEEKKEIRVVKVGVVKNGNLGACPVLDLIFDERADRDDVDFRVLGSGAKLGKVQCVETMDKMLEFKPELIIMISPNAALPGPKEGRDKIKGIPTIVYSDMPAKKAVEEWDSKGIGYILCGADSMIGARRPFLDPVEMSIFNADLLTVLSITGAINCIQDEVDAVIAAIKAGEKPKLPKIIIDMEIAAKYAKISNPYAQAKAMAAFEIASRVAAIDVKACFQLKEKEQYMPLLATAHEMMRVASRLACEAREIEKVNDKVLRRPHHREGQILNKRGFTEKEA